jgi:hypothetical protein
MDCTFTSDARCIVSHDAATSLWPQLHCRAGECASTIGYSSFERTTFARQYQKSIAGSGCIPSSLVRRC